MIEIKRQSVKAMIDDILRCLWMKELSNDLHVLVLPWNYSIYTIVTDNQKFSHARKIATAVDNEER